MTAQLKHWHLLSRPRIGTHLAEGARKALLGLEKEAVRFSRCCAILHATLVVWNGASSAGGSLSWSGKRQGHRVGGLPGSPWSPLWEGRCWLSGLLVCSNKIQVFIFIYKLLLFIYLVLIYSLVYKLSIYIQALVFITLVARGVGLFCSEGSPLCSISLGLKLIYRKHTTLATCSLHKRLLPNTFCCESVVVCQRRSEAVAKRSPNSVSGT